MYLPLVFVSLCTLSSTLVGVAAATTTTASKKCHVNVKNARGTACDGISIDAYVWKKFAAESHVISNITHTTVFNQTYNACDYSACYAAQFCMLPARNACSEFAGCPSFTVYLKRPDNGTDPYWLCHVYETNQTMENFNVEAPGTSFAMGYFLYSGGPGPGK